MITAKEAKVMTDIALATTKIRDFEKDIKEAARNRSDYIVIPVHKMPLLGKEAFTELGYIVTEITNDIPPHKNSQSCLVHQELTAYRVSWEKIRKES